MLTYKKKGNNARHNKSPKEIDVYIYKEFNENGFFFATVICTLLNILIYAFMRVTNIWSGEWKTNWYEIGVVDLFITLILYVWFVLSFNSRKRKDVILISTLPQAAYMSIRALVVYEWMRLYGICILGVSIIVAWIYVTCSWRKRLPVEDRNKIIFYNMLHVLLICFEIISIIGICGCCIEKKKILNYEKYELILNNSENSHETQMYDVDYKFFRAERYKKLTSSQREQLGRRLAEDTLNYLIGDMERPDIEFVYYIRGEAQGECYGDTLRFNRLLYSFDNEEDIKKYIYTIFHECYHYYSQKCIDTFIENENAEELMYYRKIKEWENNKNDYINGRQDFFLYQHQPLEKDADYFAETWCKLLWEYIN